MATSNYSSWSGGDPSRQGPSTTATVVDTDPPESLSAWPNRGRLQPGATSWPSKKVPERRPRRAVPSADVRPVPAAKRRHAGRWVVLFSSLAFAAGLWAGPAAGVWADRAVAAAVPWMVRSAPSILRPYLPRPPEEPRPLVRRARPAQLPATEPSAPPEHATKHPSQARRTHGKRGSAAVTPATHAAPANKPATDPFEQP